MLAAPSTIPKVVLHDHLDGGLRPQTLGELAEVAGYDGLDAHQDLQRFFAEREVSSLEDYLEVFAHTLAVMQTPDSIRRVACEAVVDHYISGVEYAELRFAPSLHTNLGLTRDEAIEHALEGLELAETATGATARLIVCAMRQDDDALEVAEAAARFVGHGVVGFDLAGPETGFSPDLHQDAFEVARGMPELHTTIHAGEGDGVASIAAALDCGAERLGHGVRIVEDIDFEGDRVDLGEIAIRVLDEGVALEVCPTSEVQTNAVPSAEQHPAVALHRAGFKITVNTDNRLVSNTDMNAEFEFLAERGFDVGDFKAVTLYALESAFCDDETRERVSVAIGDAYGRLI